MLLKNSAVCLPLQIDSHLDFGIWGPKASCKYSGTSIISSEHICSKWATRRFSFSDNSRGFRFGRHFHGCRIGLAGCVLRFPYLRYREGFYPPCIQRARCYGDIPEFGNGQCAVFHGLGRPFTGRGIERAPARSRAKPLRLAASSPSLKCGFAPIAIHKLNL
jgi:hypothetical protein